MPTRTILAPCAVGLVALVAGAPFVLNEGLLRLATECLLLLTMAQMWNLLAGYAGLVSLGHQVFVAFGATWNTSVFWFSLIPRPFSVITGRRMI